MITTMTALLQAAGSAAAGSGISFWIMIIALFAIMYFFMIRPQQKKQKEIQKFQNSLTEGTPVVTGGGVYGTVKRIDLATNTVEVEVAKGVVVRVDRGYVFKDMASKQKQA